MMVVLYLVDDLPHHACCVLGAGHHMLAVVVKRDACHNVCMEEWITSVKHLV